MGVEQSTVLAQLKSSDELGQGRIAMALPWLGAGDAVVGAFKTAYVTLPLDVPIAQQHHGVEALLAVAPRFLDAALVPWLVKTAIEMPGGDTAVAPFRDAAMAAAQLLMTHEQIAEVEKLGALITPDKWTAAHDEAKAILGECKADVSCFLSLLQAAPTPSFGIQKRAIMVGVYADESHVDAIARAITVQRGEQIQLLALALDKVTKKTVPTWSRSWTPP